MNTKKTNSVAVSTSKFSIVRAISAFLKLGNDGKLESFFTRVTKALGKEIAAHEKNLSNLKFNHDQAIDELNDSLEDAQVALNEAYMKVDMDQIGKNAEQSAFQEIYLDNLDNHELNVQAIEKRIESEKEAYSKAKSKIDEQIASLNKRIAKISAE